MIVTSMLNVNTLAEIIKLVLTLGNKVFEVKPQLEQSTKLKRGAAKLIILTEVYKDLQKMSKQTSVINFFQKCCVLSPNGTAAPSREVVLGGEKAQNLISDVTAGNF